MKKQILLLTTVLALGLTLGACRSRSGGESGGGGNTSEEESFNGPTCTVKFYISYNHYDKDLKYEPYFQTKVERGQKIKRQPETPEAPYPEFPVFKGWSKYHVLDNYEGKIWNFETDATPNSSTLELFGIWVAQGE